MRVLGGCDRVVCMMDFGLECSLVGDGLFSIFEFLGFSFIWVLFLVLSIYI